MDEMKLIADLIGQYCFPIVCCFILFRSMEKEREVHREETNALTHALEDNTRVMTELKTLFEVHKNEIQNFG